MTIRELIRARKRKFEAGAAVFIAGVACSLLLEWTFSLDHVRVWQISLGMATAAGGLALALAIFRLYRCPCCNAFLSPGLRVGPFKPVGPLRQIDYCPYCGVHLDDEFDKPN